jgi:hypothetical protein
MGIGVLVPSKKPEVFLNALFAPLRLPYITLPSHLVDYFVQPTDVYFVWQTQLLFV